MQGHVSATIIVRRRWWLTPYLAGVKAMVLLTGLEPDWDNLRYWIRRGLYTEIFEV